MKTTVGPCLQSAAVIPRGLLLASAGALALAAGGTRALAAEEGEGPGPPPSPGPATAPAPAPPSALGRFVVESGYGSSSLEGGQLVIYLVEGVYLAREGFSVEARNLVVWGDPERMRDEEGPLGRLARSADARPKEEPPPAEPAPGAPPTPPGGWSKFVPSGLGEFLGPVLHELYAEGDVRFTIGTRTIRTERLFVDFRRNLLATGRVQMTLGLGIQARGRTIPLVVRAARMRQTAVDTLTMEDAVYSTCDFAHPHYSFRCSELVLTQYEDHQVFTAYRNLLSIEGVPVFWFPVLGGRSDLSARPLRSVSFEQSSRFGRFVQLLWSDRVILNGENWGEWRLRTDYRSKRGPGVGPEYEYNTGRYRGELLAYWQKDNEETDAFDDSPVTRDERGRVRWEHRHRLSPDLRLDLSLFDFSDRNFQPEYLEKEYLEDRDPETYASLRWQRRHDTATLSAKFHNDRFRTETTETPEGAFRRAGAPVPSRWTRALGLDQAAYSLDLRAGAYERRFDEALGVRGDRVVREDAVFRAEGVRWVGPVALSPIAVAGATGRHGDEGPGAGRDEARADLAWGARARIEARRDFEGVRSRTLDLDGLRHLVGLEALAYDRFAVTEEPAGADAVDRIDRLDEVRVGVLGLRNRLQTMRGGRRVDWVDLELRTLWFPEGLEGRASPLRFKEEGLEEARFQDFLGEEKHRALPPRGRSGTSDADLRVRLRENLYLLGEGEYDPDEDGLRTAAAGVRWFRIPTLSVYAGNRRIRHDSNIWVLSADAFISDRWAVRFIQQTDYRNDRGLKTDVRLRRVLHDFVVEVGLERDLVTDDTTVSLQFVPTALWDSPTSAERLGRLDFEAQRWYR